MMKVNINLIFCLIVVSLALFSCAEIQDAPEKTVAAKVETTAKKAVKSLTKEQKIEKISDKKFVLKAALERALQESPMVLFKKFNLTKEQTDVVSKSLETNEISKVSATENPTANPKFQSFEKEVRGILNPKQQELFEDLLEKMKE